MVYRVGFLKEFLMKKVLITGAMSGIGLAAAKQFLNKDWTVVLADKNKNNDVLDELNEVYEGGFYFIKTDVSKAGDVERLYKEVQMLTDGVNCIVNNAGIISHGLLHEETERMWDELMNTDVKSIFLTSKYFIPDLIQNGGGTIINTASISGLLADYKMPIYNAAKGAVVNLTRAMALDYAEFNIRVNSVCPAAVRTPMLNSENIEKYARSNPLKRICEPEEVAKAVYFLATSESSYCNGVNLPVTGGLDVWSGQPK